MIFDTRKLAAGLDLANLVIERRNAIPVLGCAAIDVRRYVDREELRIRGTDLDMEIEILVPVETGPTVGPSIESANRASPLDIAEAIHGPAALARLLRAGGRSTEIFPDSTAHVLAIRSGQLSGSIGALPIEDFPPFSMAEPDLCHGATLGLDAIDMILRVSRALSTDPTRYYLNGVCLHHVTGWTFKVVATDGHRLHVGTIELPDFTSDPHLLSDGIIIPTKMIQILQRLRPRIAPEAPIALRIGASGPPRNATTTLAPEHRSAISRVSLAFQAGSLPVTIRSKLIDGTYPSYDRVIPKHNPDFPSILVGRRALAAAIAAISSGATGKTAAIKLTFDPDNGLIVSMKWIDLGFDGKISVPAIMPAGSKPFEVGYNGRYLQAICDAETGDDLAFNVESERSPGIITDPSATDFLSVLMPMRI